jgi:hypothetical protein
VKASGAGGSGDVERRGWKSVLETVNLLPGMIF